MYTPIKITNGVPSFLHQKKKTAATSGPRLQKLNAVTVKNAYPLPLIPDILNKVSEARPSISLSWMSAGDTTTFGSRRRQVEGCLLDELSPFQTSGHVLGLTNSPATFQMMMIDTSRTDRQGSSDHLYG